MENPGVNAPEGFLAHLSQLTAYAVVTLVGELTFAVHEEAERYLAAALEMTRTAVIVDMTELTFCDSSGVNVIAKLARAARNSGGVAVVLVGLTGRVLTIFTVTGMIDAFTTYPDLDTAFRALDGVPSLPPEASAAG